MGKNKNMLLYEAFGFRIASEIHMPELSRRTAADDIGSSGPDPDIEIVVSELSELWRESKARHGRFNVENGNILFEIPELAIFCVQEGRRIIVSPAAGSNEDEIRLYILGTCMGGLLMQRSILPLHGSAIEIDGMAYAVVGESGAGKSTTSAALLRNGCRLLSDDVIAVSYRQGSQVPIVTPAYPQQKLWQESLDRFGDDSSGYRSLGLRETKFSVPVASRFLSTPLPLGGIFELVITDQPDIDLQLVGKLERLPLLYRHTFRHTLIHRLGMNEWHLGMTASIANELPIYRLARPVSRFTAGELAALIQSFAAGEKVYS